MTRLTRSLLIDYLLMVNNFSPRFNVAPITGRAVCMTGHTIISIQKRVKPVRV